MAKKNFLVLASSFPILLLSSSVFAGSSASSSAETYPSKNYPLPLGKNAILTINSPRLENIQKGKKKSSSESIPRKWRTSDDPVSEAKKTGLEQVRESGSAEFSRNEFVTIQKKLQKKGVSLEHQIYVDLREESHGFVEVDGISDGIALSWYQGSDTVNAGKTHEEVLADEKKRLAQLAKESQVVLYQFKEKEEPENAGKPELRKKEQLIIPRIKSFMTEQELVESHGSKYIRITSPDHHRPGNEDVDQFMKVYSQLDPKKDWVHFHCAAGMGRTTTFMTMLDMLRNYDKKDLSFDDFLTRQWKLGGTLLKDSDKKVGPDRAAGRAGRIQFIRDFFEYTRSEGPKGYKKPWSQWTKERKAR
jgi:hypothetical protein